MTGNKESTKLGLTNTYLPASLAGVIFIGEQSQFAHSSIIVINELHNSGNILIEECGGGIIGQILLFRDRGIYRSRPLPVH